MNLTLSAKQWVAIGIVLMTQSSRIVHSQVIAFASMPAKQHTSLGQEMKLKNVLLDLQRHYGVEIIFEDRLVGSVNVASSNLDFNSRSRKTSTCSCGRMV
jgi:TonB-dependent starch-binding outer membrane protein SusC